jgi:hypothetical protein
MSVTDVLLCTIRRHGWHTRIELCAQATRLTYHGSGSGSHISRFERGAMIIEKQTLSTRGVVYVV